MEKSRLPYGVGRSGRSDLGDEHTCGPERKRMTAGLEKGAVLKSLYRLCGAPTQSERGEGRCRVGRNGYEHHTSRRGRGPSTQGQMRRDNVGKVLLPAGADSNLHRPGVEGTTEARGGWRTGA